MDIENSTMETIGILHTQHRKRVSLSDIIDKTEKLCYCKSTNLSKSFVRNFVVNLDIYFSALGILTSYTALLDAQSIFIYIIQKECR